MLLEVTAFEDLFDLNVLEQFIEVATHIAEHRVGTASKGHDIRATFLGNIARN